MMLDTLFLFQVDPKVLLPYRFHVLIRVTYSISQFRRNALYALVGSVSSIQVIDASHLSFYFSAKQE